MKYRTIVADPPWEYPCGFAQQSRTPGKWEGPVVIKPLPYPAMSLNEIAALPVDELAAPSARLFCWTTNRYLPATFAIIDGWRFKYRQTVVWNKTDANVGGSVAPNAEFLVVAARGTPGRARKWPSAVVTTSAPKQHSRKPEVFMDLIEQVSPGPYLELFARRQRLGWDTWGNEALEHVSLTLDKGGGTS